MIGMTEGDDSTLFVFPRWSNYALPVIALAVFGGMLYVPTLITLGASPRTTAVGYSPTQPVPYSHRLHVGQLGLDCRYCHFTVEKTAFASLPPTQVCMNCHTKVKPESAALAPVRKSWLTGEPVEWVKIHNLANYVYFNHSAHVNHGVGCVSCHGRIDQMDQVAQQQPLSMGWCLDCHRNTAKNLRPLDEVTNLGWKPDPDVDPVQFGLQLQKSYGIHDVAYMTSCSTCHR
jgi:menaquinone reductase, multiheme cytochrome c subunit